jgi:nucleoside-diphosphate-sugar epimerase
MKVAVFGGTGRTGQLVVQQALASGFEVTMLARTLSKMPILHEQLSIVGGNLLDEMRVEEVVQSADSVLSVLGPSSNKPEFAISKGIQIILRQMVKHDVRRIVISAGAGVREPQDRPKPLDIIISFLLGILSKNVVADMQATVREVEASDRDWTVVRVPMLTDQPAQQNLKIGYVGDIGPRLSRVDMASFLVKQLTDKTFLRQAPVISN